ncbi:pilus assembly protein [Rhodoferax sp. U11-2br]|uniref:pilus assembly protein n=1 Tax=Rhodoferax sp. U11-2br TaxID=2838878 RepID=UPI001BE70395|nr:PilC/PilY family type IV pilus protein [Rhodoferax sp. U11-2br]MBT3066087.1 hypothetical protein [Rhodoferax sp. U11-2br]
MRYSNYIALSVKSAALTMATLAALASSAVTIPTDPLITQIKTPPMVMLIASKDHKLFVEAYNDASDLDGDGKLDLRFKPSITYYGLFDSKVCYTHNGVDKGNDGVFTPSAAAGTKNICTNSWSGNWLNYVTTSRIDSLRKVLYGGYRWVDNDTDTVLRRAYIPQDAHSWAKEYTSETVDGYKISDYTPLSQPSDDTKRHFFGNLTANATTNCKNPDTCSNLPPLLSVVKNSNLRVWDWASKAAPVLDGNHGGTRENYTVQVKVCTASFHENCKQYGSIYKPVGLLHDYGENDSMLFGLLTGSYNNNMSGGVLRKKVSSFKDEVDSSTGIFKSDATIVNTFNRLRIRDFNNNRTDYAYRNSSLRTRLMSEGEYVDWGNPVAEMMYEGLRYFEGKSSPTPEFDTSGSHDEALGLPRVAKWNNPFIGADDSITRNLRCSRPNMLVMSDVYPSYDGDQIPGSPFSSLTGDISGLDASTLLTKISDTEPDVKGLRFVGQSTNTNLDYAPSPKTVTSLSTVRGLAPEEPTKQGSYNAAAIAYFGKTNDISNAADTQNLNTFILALSSTLPKFEVPVNGKKIQIVPFAKTINGLSADRTKGKYQPTDQIVDLYVTKDDLNGPTKEMVFKINYEADEQGNDYDMDIIAEYTIKKNDDNTATVQVEVTQRTTGSNQNVGYAISGTNRDGIYLVAQDTNDALNYFLNVPPGRNARHCQDEPNLSSDECKRLPGLTSANPKSTQVFTSGTGDSGQFLQNPLWYAAKWGGFNDISNNKTPDLPSEWDTNGDGVPDNYFLVQNPIYLRDSLKSAFDNIFNASSSASNVIANSTSITDSTSTQVFQARFDANKWSGDLVAYPITTAGLSITPVWQAQHRMPAPADRKLFVRTPSGVTKPFVWNELPSADKALLDADSSSANNSSDVVAYLRGSRDKEIKGSTGIFRERVSLEVNVAPLGDIVHSSPFFDQDNDVLYVNANDGMLHAFRASDVKDSSGNVLHKAGSEIFGFIPSAVVSRLKNLTSPGYTHEFLVDGDVVVSPKTAETGDKRLLFGTLGRGGKGLFGLNVTTPTGFGTSDFLWEYTPTGDSSAISDGVKDTAVNANTDQDLGLMLGRPVYAKMNYGDNGTGAVIVGNGYNSTSGKAVLYIFLLDTDGKVATVKKLDTLIAGDNGLATPSVLDVDGNGTVDYIYAGDLKGNVWKFDVRGKTTASWSVGLSGKPLFVAKDTSNKLQPITSPITFATDTVAGDPHVGKRFVFFGTGSYFRSVDPADASVQSWYGLIDEDEVITDRTALKQRSVAITGIFDNKPVRGFSVAEPNDMVGKKGWYIDFENPAGERIVTEPMFYKFAVPALVASSIIPATGDPCIPGGSGYLNVINPFNGAATSLGILDVDENKSFKNDVVSGYVIGSIDLGVGLLSRVTLVGNRLVVGGTDPNNPVEDIPPNFGVTPLKGRISWREIITD